MKKEPDGKPYWIKLLAIERLRVTRCDENGNSFSRGECFRIIDESAANERSDLRYDRNNPDRTTKAGLKDRRTKPTGQSVVLAMWARPIDYMPYWED